MKQTANDTNAVDDETAEERPQDARRTAVVTAAVVAASAALTVLLLSGWTPGSSVAQSNARGGSVAPPAAGLAAAPAPVEARVLFEEECGVCHTLAAAGTSGEAGPNLDRLRPSAAQVRAAIANGGKGSGLMPAAVFDGADAARVARFVARSTRR